MPRVSYMLALLCLPFVVGCEGCRRSDEDEQDQQQDEAPVEDFTARAPLAFPGDANPLSGGIKPGHWITASQALRSNKVDARGQLLSRASATGSSFQTGETQTSDGEIQTVRPVVLPKGQMRRFDYRILTPIPRSNDNRRNFLSSRFVSSRRAIFFDTGRQPFNVLSGEEYFFVVLTSRPERFAKFQVSDWARPYRDEDVVFRSSAANYRIIFPPTDDLLPLAETMLDWSNTAVVLWDDLSPDALTPQQQTAIADWVRFGGQLIVNGAPAADAISRTSLADLLPLDPTGNIELDPTAAEELLNGWAVETDRSTEKQIALLNSQGGRVAVDGVKADNAQVLDNSGNLVLWQRVGVGRVVQPRFDVTSDWLLNWQSYDSFVNAALLSRPRRELIESPDANDLSMIRQLYPDLKTSAADPAFNSRFRITARDAVLRSSAAGDVSSSATSSRYDYLTDIDSSTGVGGWTDNSDTISLCQDILRKESGIEIPDSSLVIRTLGYYLLILVPINYLVFRLLGRLEYAWLAVPVIAIGGAIWVARAARLDIGFARSQTEIALLELQPDYGRGHLTRVVAIYNSLSDSYDVQFDSIDGVAAPIWLGESTPGASAEFRTGFSEGPMLAGLAVGSNQVRMLHAEQIMDVGGPIEVDSEGQLINRTKYELFDALVIEKSESGDVRYAVAGGCESGSAVALRFRESSSVPKLTDELPMQTAMLLARLSSPSAMANGSTRLVARLDSSLPGMTITPDAKQTLSQTIVLAHLKHAPLPEPQVDVNLIGDLRRVLGDDDPSAP